MKFLIDKSLLEQIRSKYGIPVPTEKAYEDNKVWFDLEELEPFLDAMLYGYTELKEQLYNDYIPEREVPEIHGKGISW